MTDVNMETLWPCLMHIATCGHHLAYTLHVFHEGGRTFGAYYFKLVRN